MTKNMQQRFWSEFSFLPGKLKTIPRRLKWTALIARYMCQYMKIILILSLNDQQPLSARETVFNINADICLGAKK